ncbi:MAG TPA: UbiD family decarboxylase [Candidatus Binatia bacterium]|jgi:4-hydroxy-3-polyprenylbenzoate decarboxylase|nr:UbiD family decarboxylase [Candidatus Binatia bacterium]
MAFNDLREFIQAARALNDLKEIHGAHWDLEIGALLEIFASRESFPLLLFDQVPGYPASYRVAGNLINHPRRNALAVGLDPNLSRPELVRRWKEILAKLSPIPHRTVKEGPLFENVRDEASLDMTMFPTPKWHELDGGRYIGTGCCVITADPDDGWVNVGIYRVQIHDNKTLGLYISPGHHARIMREKFWEQGKACPVAVTFGQEPLLWMTAGMSVPYGVSEYDYAGGLRRSPVDVVRGPITGLPIPATAEIAIEGEVPPPSEETRIEGPFGEWPGYYAHGAKAEPIIRVKALYHRSDPILAGAPPLKPPVATFGVPIGAAAIWNYLEKADVPDIRGVWIYIGGSAPGGGAPFVVVSLKQRYQGHAQQAGIAALGCRAGNYHGRFVVVVDEDIDPSNLGDVIWAISTRCDPKSDMTIVDGCWSTLLDPVIPPDRKEARDLVSSRAILNACRPYAWKDQFPPVNALRPELRKKIEEKWKSVLG